MNRKLTYTILEEIILKNFLKSKGYSSNLISNLKKNEKSILVNEKNVFVNHKLKKGDILKINIYEDKIKNAKPVNLHLNIIYEDLDIMIVNKISNMPVHQSSKNYDNALSNAISYYFYNKQQEIVFRAVNRLDRDTTGIVLIAKNPLSSCILAKMIKENKINREYMAIVKGDIEEKGIINLPIAREKDSIIKRCVNILEGSFACTKYQKIFYKNKHSLVAVKLLTGKTHQIRVHFNYIGFPLVGDFLYNPDYSNIKRQSLHCFKMELNHPITNEKLCFFSPIPKDMNFIFK